MTKIIKTSLAAFFCIASISAHAESSILLALKSQRADLSMMSDQKLDEIRGAAKIFGQPLPSVTLGLKTYHVTWKQFGAMDDYRSYIRHGFSYNPGVRNTVVENEVVHDVAGDVWFADRISNPNTWNSAYSVRIDSHLQALDKTTGQPMNFGWRTTSWNRPISTFRW